ncbi:MAG: hypothetical protein H7A50_13540 [Akkermansiaceae bacterium]|nr:hypothetical protein [Akkermansiaceae bacterium]
MFSSGVMLAMTSGVDAAKAVDEALRENVAISPAMKRYEQRVWRNVRLYWRFIEPFYQTHFAQLFFQPANKLHMVCAVNSVLAGRTDLPLSVRWRLNAFFFLAWLNQRVPVVERIKIG